MLKNNLIKILFVCLFIGQLPFVGQAQQIALLKYNGGGDWYVNPTSLPNLIKFCNAQIGTSIDP